jgi:hypothetical protein
MVDQCGLPDAGPGNDRQDIYLWVYPGVIQKSDILLSTKQIASCNWQSGYGNLLRRKSCSRLASSDARNGRGRLQEALTNDSMARVESACYGRYRRQQLARSPKTLRRIFLKEFLKENYDRLWDMFEPLKW